MKLEQKFDKIREFILDRYKDNLAALLVFGSANTGGFIEGRSDVDTMVFLKRWGNLTREKEIELLLEKLKRYSFRTQYFHTLRSIRKYVQERTSFSTYIVIVAEDGSRVLYSTPEFEKLKAWFRGNPPAKQAIKKYLREKDRTEIDGYFKDEPLIKRTRSIFAHLRRKLQVINYFQTRDLVFDYVTCLDNVSLPEEEKEKLRKLHSAYSQGEELSEQDAQNYITLAKQYTEKLLK